MIGGAFYREGYAAQHLWMRRDDCFGGVQVVTSIGELVEMCSPRILSGWRPLFSALRTAHGAKMEAKDYVMAEYEAGT